MVIKCIHETCEPNLYLCSTIVRRWHYVLARAFFKLNTRHQVRMSRDGVNTGPFSKIPYFASVVFTPSYNVIAVRWDIDTQNTFKVSLHEHDATTRSKVPDSPKRIHASEIKRYFCWLYNPHRKHQLPNKLPSDSNWTITMECNVVNWFWMSFLMENLYTLFQIP